MRVVELLGLPGCGKSAIVREAVQCLDGDPTCLEYCDVMPLARERPFSRVRHALAFAGIVMRRPDGWAPLSATFGRGNDRQRRRVTKYLDLCVRLRRHAGRGDLAILDQGPLQALASILIEGEHSAPFWRRDLLEFGSSLWLPDVLCYVELCPELAAARVSRRGHGLSFFDHLDQEELLRRYRSAGSVFNELVGVADSRRGVLLIRLRGEDSAAANGGVVARIARELRGAALCGSA